jgi:hypothetical protein
MEHANNFNQTFPKYTIVNDMDGLVDLRRWVALACVAKVEASDAGKKVRSRSRQWAFRLGRDLPHRIRHDRRVSSAPL